MTHAIEAQGLVKRFGARTAVNGLDLAIRQGELFSLLGVNGAGKTTAIKLLSCLLRPTAGDAFVMGHSVTDAPERVKPLINVSPQETAVARNLTVRENLELIYGIYGHTPRDARAMADDALTTYRLTDVAAQRAATLSGGWQRRLSIAMALVTRPRVLFLDEPTLGLDVLARRELWELIRSLSGDNMTVVLTTHYLEEAEALSHRIGILSDGTLAACGTPDELKALAGADNIEDAFIALCGKGGVQS